MRPAASTHLGLQDEQRCQGSLLAPALPEERKGKRKAADGERIHSAAVTQIREMIWINTNPPAPKGQPGQSKLCSGAGLLYFPKNRLGEPNGITQT